MFFLQHGVVSSAFLSVTNKRPQTRRSLKKRNGKINRVRKQNRTAASLLFDSLRSVVRERHTLKGAGVRVSAVAGVDLPPPRPFTTGTSSSGSPDGTASSSNEGGLPLPPPPPALVPAGLLNAVGSGVINVSPGGHAVVEHLGRGGVDAYGNGDAPHDDGAGWTGGDDAGSRAAAAQAEAAMMAGASQQDSTSSLWRLRAARRRRQARGDKMRALVRWSIGEDMAGGGGGSDRVGGGGHRERGAVNPVARGSSSSTSRMVGRSGSLVGVESPGLEVAEASGVLRQDAVVEAEEESGGRQSMGWGSALQARAALALPASFLPKRT